MEAGYFNRLLSAKRIVIFGIPGSGKSTFALKWSKLLHLPLFHLDKYFFKDNWIERDTKEFLEIQKELVDKESWIIDGNSIKSLEMRFSKADIVLYFRFNRLLCLWRIFKRLLCKNPHISDRAEGCRETLRLRLIKYLWDFPKRVEHPLEELRNKYPNIPLYEIKKDSQLRFLLKNAKKAKKEKYSYKSYSHIFPSLFTKEKARLLAHIPNSCIEHVGSTAVPGLAGKGIIDIAIAVGKDEMEKTSKTIQNLGYEFRPSFSTPDRFYFVIYLSDPKESTRRYHIHLTYIESNEWKGLLQFRDYLRNNKQAAKEYSELKEKAAKEANQDGAIYKDMKASFFKQRAQ